MSNKLRSVNTKFWDDPYIVELCPEYKLLFLYMLTNPLTRLSGIYEISEKRITFDTGLSIETVRNGFERFKNDSKAFRNGSYIILPNWIKNQNLNKNMKVCVNNELSELNSEIKRYLVSELYEWFGNGSEWFETLSNGLGTIRKEEDEVEVETKIKIEPKVEEKDVTIDFYKKDFFVKQNVEPICMQFGISVEQYTELKKTFYALQIESGKKYLAFNELKSHWANWLSIQAKELKKAKSTAQKGTNGLPIGMIHHQTPDIKY